MAVVAMKQLLEAGVHFGHQTRRWNPKMAPYIFGERNGIHIVDLRQTLEQLERGYAFVRDAVADGGTVLFVGTKKQAADAIAEAGGRAGMPYVNFRWYGGMLTNFTTIHKRIFYMRELERMSESGEMDTLPKKERLRLRRELEKLHRALGGVSTLTRVPDVVFIIDLITERIAVKEAIRLGVPVVALVDTNCDPEGVTIVIPGNDDAIRAAQTVAGVIADACVEGRRISGQGAAEPVEEEPEPAVPAEAAVETQAPPAPEAVESPAVEAAPEAVESPAVEAEPKPKSPAVEAEPEAKSPAVEAEPKPKSPAVEAEPEAKSPAVEAEPKPKSPKARARKEAPPEAATAEEGTSPGAQTKDVVIEETA